MASATPAFRLDRALTLSLMRPLRTTSARLPRMKLLMYHSISNQQEGHLHPYFRTVTSPARFEAQMRFLRESGFRLMTLGQALEWSEQGGAMPVAVGRPSRADSGPVVITFDDGLRDFHTTAQPILRSLGIPATVFLSSGCLDGPFVTGQDCLRKSEVAQLAGEGVEFGSHTVSHPALVELDQTALRAELLNSRQQIEQILGAPVKLFSYPYRFPEEDAAFTGRLATTLHECGYSGGVTTVIGRPRRGDNPLFLKRLPVNDADDIALLEAKLEGAYDWLHAAQLLAKRARRLLRPGRRSH